MTPLEQRVCEQYGTMFHARPAWIVRAPGRVNLIGEHTDYNDGFVLPMAIDRSLCIAAGPREGGQVLAHSLDFAESTQFALQPPRAVDKNWAGYIQGMAWSLEEAGHSLHGWQGVLASDVPIGAGLSSSAALELAAAKVFALASGLPWDPIAMARLAQRAENQWVGVQCGIMDQMISAAGKAGHALLIDCRSLESTQVPVPSGTVIVVLDTATRRGLVDTAYNERRAQCAAAANAFGVPALRDVDLDRFVARAETLDDPTRRRARHVIAENARTLEAAEAMVQGDAKRMGQLMQASHASLRDDYEVSSPQLDAMVRCAMEQEGCYGARMTGAGFGGCAVALVKATEAERFVAAVTTSYFEATRLDPAIYVCTPADGAHLVSA